MDSGLVIGKYTLESLTNGMYSSPLDLYREYIQNAVDSIDEAIEKKLLVSAQGRIDIIIDREKDSIVIRDNGTGIPEIRAVQMLIDIGNSKKSQGKNRGFRGIGRLAGLGYCDTLTFSTSAANEGKKTVVSFDAKKLKDLLIPGKGAEESIYDVLNAVIFTKQEPEKEKSHYFEVCLQGISLKNTLMEKEAVRNYLIQNAPLPFNPTFKWGEEINKKLSMEGWRVPVYNIYLTMNTLVSEQLYKPYADSLISDRVKKLNDNIRDIQVRVLKEKENILAAVWYANTNFFGTIVDSNIKGLRVRQGNILIGDKTTCAHLFKEERFNGWVIGEVHILDSRLIANSRRDNFEKNEVYFELMEQMKDVSLDIIKEIRRLSYNRSLSNEKKAVVEADTFEDVNDLCSEDMMYASDVDELTLMESGDCNFEAESDYFSKLNLLLGKKNTQTKYAALNVNDRLTVEQRKVLERVFDLILAEYSKEEAERIINILASKF